MLTGAGGSFAQLSLYLYSLLGLVALGWGLKAVKEVSPSPCHASYRLVVRVIEIPFCLFFLLPPRRLPKKQKKENAQQTLYFAHLFFVDHMVSTAWTLFFAVVWWAYTPHDGRRVANSAAQEAIRLGAGVNHTMTDTELAAAANILWHEEKGVAAMVIVLSWLAKVGYIWFDRTSN